MRPFVPALPLLLCLATSTPAAEWISSSSLEGFAELGAADRLRIEKLVKNKIIGYSFEDAGIEWRIHAGDLRIAGNFDNEGALIVDGSLKIDGSYDDYGSGAGLLIVLGDLEAEHVFSWNGLYVRGAVKAAGLVYGAYNDYAFEADGGVTARGIVMDDHSSSFTVAQADFAIDNNQELDEEDFGQVIRRLVPEVLTDPAVLELDEFAGLGSLWPSYDVCKERARAGQPLFRAQAAADRLVEDARLAISPESRDEQLLALLGRDHLTDRLVAARPELSKRLVEALLKLKDPGVRAWLAGQVTDLEQLGGAAALTVNTAERLVANPRTPEKTLLAIARAGDVAVRRTLAQRSDLPVAVLLVIAADADPELCAAVLSNFDNAARLPAAEQRRLAKDKRAIVREAIARAPLPYELAAALAADDNREVRLALAYTLAAEVDSPFPASSQAEREKLAELLFAGEDHEIAEAVFVALPAARQAELYATGTLQLDWPAIADATRSQPLMRLMLEKEQELELQGHLAENLALPLAAQLQIVERARKPAKNCEGCVLYSSPDDVLEALVSNDNVSPRALLEASRLAAERPTAGFVDALTNNKDIPLEGLQLLDAIWAGGEDWSLSLLFMHEATREMLERAIPRWYEDEEVSRAIARISGLEGDAWWRALAKSDNRDLREVAAWNVNTPVELLGELLRDPDPEVSASAAGNPRQPLAAFAAAPNFDPEYILMSPRFPLAELAEKTRSAAKLELRRRALELYVQRKLRNW